MPVGVPSRLRHRGHLRLVGRPRRAGSASSRWVFKCCEGGIRRIAERQALHRSSFPIASQVTCRRKFNTSVPVVGPVEDHQQLPRELLRLRQREELEQLVERAEAAREDHQRLGEIREPELPHEEVVEVEAQARASRTGSAPARTAAGCSSRSSCRRLRWAPRLAASMMPGPPPEQTTKRCARLLEGQGPGRSAYEPARARPRSSATTGRLRGCA